jgi:ABC-2 type transport system ATP-binding protein
MRIICGLLAPDRGSVSWRGAPIDGRARERIGYMPEERGLYPKMRLADQLEYFAVLHGASHRRGRAAALFWLERLGLGERVLARVEALSHGNQQRVQLAAALVFDPIMLVLDEPFSSLDPVAVDVMSAVLREQADAGLPVIFSSHELELVERICDRVAIVDRGKVVAHGTVAELRTGAVQRRLVDVPNAAAGWGEGIQGTTLISRDGSGLLFEIAPGADDQALLQAALATGPVREFHRVEPSLGDIFRTVLQEDASRTVPQEAAS